MIQKDARFIDGFFRSQTSGGYRIAWDRGGPCGEKFLDLIAVRLPYSQKYYQNLSDTRLARTMPKQLDNIPQLNQPKKHYLVYMDKVRKNGFGRPPGFGEVWNDPDPSIENYNNIMPNQAFLAGDGSRNFVGVPRIDQRRSSAIHEILHTLGAVIDGAPAATTRSHCRDEIDVMCYDDDGRGIYWKCRKNILRLDCGRNTYFKVNARSGWLSKNWNVANSPYLIGSPLRP